MPTDRQLAANKRNAQKSTGPKTPEGRAAVRLNGVKHGLNAETLVLPGEANSDFDNLLASFERSTSRKPLPKQPWSARWRWLNGASSASTT